MGSLSLANVAFFVAALLPLVAADAAYYTDLKSYQDGVIGTEPNQTFHSSPIVAPIFQINRFYPDKINASDAPYIFTAGGWNGTWGSSIISSSDLSLVYQDYSYQALAQATHVWQLDGKRVYAAVEGRSLRIFNESYHQLYAVQPQGDMKGVSLDTHEGVITANNTALIIACPTETVDLSDHGGASDAKIANCKIQELDPKTNKVVFEFASLDYFHPYDSFISPPKDKNSVWDYSHQNSAQKLADGDYIASYRHLSAVIRIDGATGKVKWAMGGKRNEFKDISSKDGAAYFAYQHEARVWNESNTRFTVFDNAQVDNNGFCGGKNCSRGLELEYNETAKTVEMVGEWYHPQSLVSASRGGVQKMNNSHVFVAWGGNYGFTEYDENGDCILDFQRGQNAPPVSIDELITYRAWKDYWEPQPTRGPNISAVGSHVYVSWNGLMVSDWLLLMSDSQDELRALNKAVARSPRNGFETSFDLSGHGSSKYARVAGLDKNGTVLGSTPVVDVSTGELYHKGGVLRFSNASSEKLASEKQTITTSKGMVVPTGDASTEQFTPPSPSSTPDESGAWHVGPGYVLCVVGIAVFVH